MKIIQLCYASKRVDHGNDLLDDLREILIKSRLYNKEKNICGVLYYAHGYYFQCIQGEAESIIELYSKIIKDYRHNEIKLIQNKLIEKKCFNKWAMKYVQPNTKLNNFFITSGFNCFRPHKVNEKIMDDFLNIILEQVESKSEVSNQGFMSRGYSHYF